MSSGLSSETVRSGGVPPEKSLYVVKPRVAQSERFTQQYSPKSQSNYSVDAGNGSTQVIIHIPQAKYMDPENCHLVFTLGVTGGTAGTTTFSDGACSFIKTLEIESGSSSNVLERIDNFNILSKFLHKVTYGEDAYESALNLEGFMKADERRTVTAAMIGGTVVSALTYTFSVNLAAVSGILGCDKYLPLKFMQGGLTLRMTLEDPNNVFSGASVTSYQLSDVYYTCDMVDFKDKSKYDSMMQEKLSSGGISIDFAGWNTHQHNISSGVSSQSIELSDRASSIKTIMFAQQLEANWGTNPETKDNLALTDDNGLSTYQFEIAGNNYPRFPCPSGIANPVRALVERTKAFNGMNDALYTTKSFGFPYFAARRIQYTAASAADPVAFTVQAGHGVKIGDILTALNYGTALDATATSVTVTAVTATLITGTSTADTNATGGTGPGYLVYTTAANDPEYKGPDDTLLTNLIFAQNFESHKEGRFTEAGESTDSSVPVRLKLMYSSSSAARLYAFVYTDRRLHIGIDGFSQVME